MQLDVGIAFFVLGLLATLLKSNIHFPKSLYQSLVLLLMLAIGLKGGVALTEHASWQLLGESLAIIALGLVLPLIAFPILKYIGDLPRVDAAAIAAHYGSVSVGTYAVAVAFLEAQQIPYEAYIPLFVVLLEMPAIAVGIALAKWGTKADDDKVSNKALLHEVLCNQGMVLMVGALAIGYLAGDQIDRISPLFFDLFNGILALFLLQMGITAASRLNDIKRVGSFIVAFAIAMPLIGGLLGALLSIALGLSQGGTILVAILGASASYIAVPAAMQVALPQANHSLSISAALAVTFPFNVLIGIPTITVITQQLIG
ncbi:sodium-dependent bicarbonate transport family permease [Ferrimonas senticii]|uniref:sodium-dependent bicarbonate transport family permease n=1 Tax=Ferrimonas senticii TaxID=394566 RepID=UPI000408ACC4|nr:sodium-dependent bicarbonate transport family permease [Ferrimonas senticii]